MAKVALVNVVKKFGRTIAVDHVSLKINDGEFYAFLGPSGSGKTTTLRLIAGLETPDEGEIYIDDRLVNYVHPRDRDVAMVFQNYALYPHMTVYDNIAFPLMARRKQLKLTISEVRSMVLEVSKLLGIEHLLDRYPSQLSGGQQQRVALARALVRRPKVWLLDEPLSNLDAKLRLSMRVELKKMQRTLGITTIYVTHDQVEAMSMADRIAVMECGRVMQIGTPDELYYRPSNVFVATFIGAPPMNLIPCSIVEGESVEYTVPERKSGGIAGSGRVKTRFFMECPDLRIPIDPEVASTILREAVENKLYLGIRSEHISILRDRPLESIGVSKAVVEVVEPLGSESIVTIRLGGETLKVRQPPGEKYLMGEEVYIDIDLRRALVFNAVSGRLVI
ncbi:MAG: ABC transporter ATP-binding protein [Desulfurococcaceae archaeon]